MIEQLLQGDCLELLKDIPDKSINCIICDLPFGSTPAKWDERIDFDLLWAQYKRVIKDGAICLFATQPFSALLISSNLPWFKYEWIWQKSNPANIASAKTQPMKYHESIAVFGGGKIPFNKQMLERSENGKRAVESNLKNRNSWKASFKDLNSTEGSWERPHDKYDKQWKNPSSILKFNSVRPTSREKVDHPTQKPVDLCEYLVKTYTSEGDIVLDNTCGSGSTLVAAKKLGRQFIGMEREQKYIDIARERLEKTERPAKKSDEASCLSGDLS